MTCAQPIVLCDEQIDIFTVFLSYAANGCQVRSELLSWNYNKFMNETLRFVSWFIENIYFRWVVPIVLAVYENVPRRAVSAQQFKCSLFLTQSWLMASEDL